jgi:hypothetical protein
VKNVPHSTRKERLSVFVIAKDLPYFEVPADDMVESLWNFYAGLPWHSPIQAQQRENVNISRCPQRPGVGLATYFPTRARGSIGSQRHPITSEKQPHSAKG